MRRLVLFLAALLFALPLAAQDGSWIRYYPPAGIAQLSSSGTAITSTVPLLLPDGTVLNPSLSFALDTGTGIYRNSNNSVSFAASGVDGVRIGGALQIRSSWFLGWTIPTADLLLGRDAAATLQLGTDAATAIAQTLKGSDSTGAATAGGSLTLKGGAGTSGNANGGQLILQGGANAGTGEPGAVAIADGGTKPTCDAARRGSIWYDAGGAGVADTFEVCAKAAAGDTYAWRVLATIP